MQRKKHSESRSEEEKLVVRAKEGDARAYAVLFRRHYTGIYDYIMRKVRNRSDAEDLTSEVFVHGFGAIGNFELRDNISIRAWFYRIAHNIVIDHYRRKRQTVPIEEAVGIGSQHDVENEVIAKNEIDDVTALISSLPDAQAEVLTLRFIKDLSVAETAFVLGKEEATVRALQFKGVRSLRKKLTERNGPGAGPGAVRSR